MINVVYDACVLHSASLRDLLMYLADTNMFHARWTDAIHEEWIRSVIRIRPDLKREQLERTRKAMDAHADDCLVTGYEHLIETLQLPDPNDKHVLAAAIWAGASCIVTYNLADFPESVLAPYGIKAITPDDFVVRLINFSQQSVLTAARKHRRSLSRPSKSTVEYLATLEQQRLEKTVAFLRQHLMEI